VTAENFLGTKPLHFHPSHLPPTVFTLPFVSSSHI